MAGDRPRPTDFDPHQALADADGASNAMANSTDAPRGFMLSLVALISTVFTLINMVPWSMVLGLSAISIPLFLWYHLAMRKRAKRRSVVKPSGPYMGFILLFMLILHLSSYWVPSSWGEAGAHWVLMFGACWLCVTLARGAEMRHRLRDANERHV